MGLFDILRRKQRIRYILAIDGGGMRGIIPSYILSTLSDILLSLGDRRPLYSHFDLIAGTSTGALLALGLSMPDGGGSLSTEGLAPYETKKGYILPGPDPRGFVEIYRSHGPEIFPRNPGMKSILYPILTDKYDVKPYERFLRSCFSDMRLSEARVPTAAIAYSTAEGTAYTMRSWDSHGMLMREAARASSAAPMYFPPAEITERDSGTKHILIDGGVVANNPALIAYEEARKLYPDASEFRILSLSTCAPRYVFDPSDGPGGITGWANPIIKVYSGAQMSLVDEIMPSIKGVEYARIWAPVLEKRIKLDATTDESVQTLLDAAERTYDATERTLRSFAYDLAEEKVHDSVRLYDDVPAMIEDSSGKDLDSL